MKAYNSSEEFSTVEAPPKYQATQMEGEQGTGEARLLISPTEKEDGDGQLETDEPTKSKDDTKMTGDDMVWIKPEGPYTPDCPIGNPY